MIGKDKHRFIHILNVFFPFEKFEILEFHPIFLTIMIVFNMTIGGRYCFFSLILQITFNRLLFHDITKNIPMEHT